MHEIRMYVCMLRVRLGLVLGRHPKINLFGLHYCVICYEVETKSLTGVASDIKSFIIDKNKFSSIVLARNCSASTLDYIVMQTRKINRGKRFFSDWLFLHCDADVHYVAHFYKVYLAIIK